MRHIVGFVHRAVYATLFALLGWYSCVFPPPFAWQSPVQKTLCYGLTFVPAVVGQLTYPLGGMDLFFRRGSTWCDFCSAQEVLWYHVRFAGPVYITLFYIPPLLTWVARRHPKLLRRIVIATAIYGVTTAILFMLTSGTDRSGDIRLAGMWFIVLAAAASVAWSRLKRNWRAIGVVSVVLLGAWGIVFAMRYMVFKIDSVRLSDYIAYVFLLLGGVSFLLGTTRAVEYGLERLREHRATSA